MADARFTITASDRTQRAFRSVQNRLRTVTRRVTSMQSRILALAGVGGFGLLITQSFKLNDQLGKTADRLGLGTQALSALRHEAALTGVESNTLDMALQRMVRRISEAAEGSGEAVDALDELGLSAERLEQLSPDQQFAAISQAMEGVANQGDRVRLAMRLFDSEGVSLLNTLERLEGRGLGPTIESLERLGVALNRQEVAQIEAANDAMFQLRQVTQGAGNLITLELAGPLQAVAERLFESAEQSDQFREAIQQATRGAVRGVGTFLTVSADAIQVLENHPQIGQFGLAGMLVFGRAGAAVGAAIGATFSHIRQELREFGVGVDDTAAALASVNSQLETVNEQIAEARRRGFEDSIDPQQRRILQELIADREELVERQRELNAAATTQTEIDLEKYWGDNAEAANAFSRAVREVGQAFRESADAEAEAIARTPPRRPNDGENEVEDDGEQEGAQAQMQKRLEAIRQSLMTERQLEQENFFAKQEQLAEFRQMEMIGQQEHYELLQGLQRQHEERMNEIRLAGMNEAQRFVNASFSQQFETVAGWMAETTSVIAQQSRAAFEVNKAAAIAQAVVKGHQAAVDAWEAGMSTGGPHAPAVAAAYMAASIARTGAQIAAIQGTQFTGAGGRGGAAPSAGGTPAPPVSPVEEEPQNQRIFVEFAGEDDTRVPLRELRQQIRRLREENPDAQLVF